MTPGEMPDLGVEVGEDAEVFEARVVAAIEFLVGADPAVVRVVEEVRVQDEILRTLVPQAEPQIDVVRVLVEDLGEMLAIRIARWAFEAGRRVGGTTP